MKKQVFQTLDNTSIKSSGFDSLFNTWLAAGEDSIGLGDALSDKELTQTLTDAELQQRRAFYSDARDWLVQAAIQSRGLEGDSRLRLARCLAGSSWARYQLGDLEISEAEALESIACFESAGNDQQEKQLYRGRAHHVVGLICFQAEKNRQAKEHFRDALKYYPNSPDVLNRALIYEKLGELADFERAFVDGQRNYDQALKILLGLLGHDSRISRLTGRVALDEVELGRYRKALRRFDNWRRLTVKLNSDVDSQPDDATLDRLEQLYVFTRLALITGDVDSAGPLLSEAQAILQCESEWPDPVLFEFALLTARLQNDRSEYQSALSTLNGITADTGTTNEVRYCRIKGETLLAIGAFTDSRVCFEQGQALILGGVFANVDTRIGIMLGLANIDAAVSNIDRLLYWPNRSINYLEQSQLANGIEMSFALHRHSRASLLGPGNDEALPICQQAIELIEIAGFPRHPAKAEFYVTLAEIHWSRGETNAAWQALETASDQKLMQCRFHPYWHAHCGRIQALMSHQCGNPGNALAVCRRSLDDWERFEATIGREHSKKSLTLVATAVIHVTLQREDLAARYLMEAFQLLERINEPKWTLAYELNRWGNVYFEQKMFLEAIWLYRNAVGLYEQSKGVNHPHTIRVRENCKLAEARLEHQVNDN